MTEEKKKVKYERKEDDDTGEFKEEVEVEREEDNH